LAALEEAVILSTTSEQRLRGVDPRLAAVVRDAALRLPAGPRFIVVEGLRTKERQAQLYAQGRTAPGPVVTWTMQSKHLDGLAVDLAPLASDGSIDWKNTAAFDSIARAMREAADALSYGIRWGADWNQNGDPREKGETDSPHFELT
jgi:peptidoglycan L-alanyl-D-glutamate endopeptidase CwlK